MADEMTAEGQQSADGEATSAQTASVQTASTQAAAAQEPAARPKVDEQLLSEVIDAIRPSFQADGGDLELVGVDEEGVVTIEMTGACAGCFMASADLVGGIDRIIMEHVPGVTAVRPLL